MALLLGGSRIGSIRAALAPRRKRSGPSRRTPLSHRGRSGTCAGRRKRKRAGEREDACVSSIPAARRPSRSGSQTAPFVDEQRSPPALPPHVPSERGRTCPRRRLARAMASVGGIGGL